MNLLDYLASLRRDLLSQIGWTEDAYSDWTHTRCNNETEQYLVLMLDKYVCKAKPFGVYLVTEYRDEPKYRRNPDGINVEDGKLIVPGGPAYVWGVDLYYGTLGHRRPYLFDSRFDSGDLVNFLVRSHREKERNAIVREKLIYKKDAPISEAINAILGDVAKAVSRAGDRQPRSGIREYLFRAVIRINDAILPFTVEEYLSHIANLNECRIVENEGVGVMP